MRTNDTRIPKQSTFIQRVFARLTDPSPARYHGVIKLRTFGRASLAGEPAAPGTGVTPHQPRERTGDVAPQRVTPKTAA